MKKVTVKELREQAKVAGIKGYSRMKKAELEAVLSEQTVNADETTEELSKGIELEVDKVVKIECIPSKITDYHVNPNIPEEYYQEELGVLGRRAIAEIRACKDMAEMNRMIDETDYFILKSACKELKLILPEKPKDELLREMLKAIFQARTAIKNLTPEDDFNARSEKMRHNNEQIKKATSERELESLLSTADEYTLRYMLKKKGYETEKSLTDSPKAELISSYVKEEMELRREAKALNEVGLTGLRKKTQELKERLSASGRESEMEEILKEYSKAELIMMSSMIVACGLKINYLQSRDKIAKEFAREYWYQTRTVVEWENAIRSQERIKVLSA